MAVLLATAVFTFCPMLTLVTGEQSVIQGNVVKVVMGAFAGCSGPGPAARRRCPG